MDLYQNLFHTPELPYAARKLINRLFFRSLAGYLVLDAVVFLFFSGVGQAWWLLLAAEVVALLLGVPASIIGVTMVAIGTSLPELVTTLTAIAKKEASMSVGNIIGANVIDLTLILPVCSAVSGGKLTIGEQTTSTDLPACLTLCCVAVLPPLLKGKFYRWQGIVMLALYAAYVVMLVA